METDLTAEQSRMGVIMNLHHRNTDPAPPPYDHTLTASKVFEGIKLEDMIQSPPPEVPVPTITHSEYEIIKIGDKGELTLRGNDGEERTDIILCYPHLLDKKMALDIRDAWNEGANKVSCTVQLAVGIEQVIAFNKE